MILVALLSGTEAQEKMSQFYLVMLRATGQAAPAAIGDIQKQHIAHIEKLGVEGHGVAAGPVDGWGNVRGILVLRAESAGQALALSSQDPAVKAGLLTPEVIPFLTSDDFGKAHQPIKMEKLYFGFVLDGPASADAAGVHVPKQPDTSFVATQTAEGRLVLSGEIVGDAHRRRGIVVYRTATIDEAREQAASDPLVMAGLLSVEIFTWYVPAGTLR